MKTAHPPEALIPLSEQILCLRTINLGWRWV